MGPASRTRMWPHRKPLQSDDDPHQRRTQQAAALTAAAQARERDLGGVLARYLADPPPGIDMQALKRPVPDTPVGLDPADLTPQPPPEWEQYAPKAPTGLAKLLGGGRYARDRKDAAENYTLAADRHAAKEAARLLRVDHAEDRRAGLAAAAREQHANIDRFVTALRGRDRRAVQRYFEQVVAQVDDPPGHPARHRVGYLPDHRLLVVEWQLPGPDVVPSNQCYHYDQQRGSIEVSERTPAERRTMYQHLLAQLVLRTLHLVFAGDHYRAVATAVVNGVVEATHPVTGRAVRPCLVTVRSTSEQLAAVPLDRYDPLAFAVRYLGAEMSGLPEELQEVTPVMTLDQTDPRAARRVATASHSDGWRRRSTA